MNILITGGASGLGKAVTTLLAADSTNHIFFTYRNSVDAAAEIEATLPNTTGIRCNYLIEGEVNALSKKIGDIDLDVLIHNAYQGEFLKDHFQKIPLTDFQEDFQLNILPVISLTQAAIQVFRKKKSGKIITVLTAALDNVPPIGSAVYVANKAYLEKLTKVWATENARYGITSNSVSPSFMATNLTRGMDERLVEHMTQAHPLKKLLTMDEAAECIKFLSYASSHINGVDLLINAGSSMT